MQYTLKFLLLFILNTMAVVTFANCQQGNSNGQWEHLPHGIAVRLTLSEGALAAYVKNTASSPLRIVGEENHLVHFFYISPEGKKCYLKDKAEINDAAAKKQSGSALIPQEGNPPFQLQIQLTSDEIAAIQTCPVACRFTVLDPSTPQYFNVESIPKVLSDGPQK
jgi:hypothetical protein